MPISCSYCNSLHTAKSGNNFCSADGDDIKSVGSNAFYINTDKMDSGPHQSRLTIRAVFGGFQYYEVDGREHLIDDSDFLIVEQGKNYKTIIDSDQPIEALIIAFSEKFCDQHQFSTFSSETELLDNPQGESGSLFHPTAYLSNRKIKSGLNKIKSAMLNDVDDHLYFDELLTYVYAAMVEEANHVDLRIQEFHAQKNSTKKELFRRISRGKDYIQVHFNKNITLQDISRASSLSESHFLRSFSQYYGQSPYQYLKTYRIKQAKHFLTNSHRSIGEISGLCGYESQASFARSFNSITGHYPSKYREVH